MCLPFSDNTPDRENTPSAPKTSPDRSKPISKTKAQKREREREIKRNLKEKVRTLTKKRIERSSFFCYPLIPSSCNSDSVCRLPRCLFKVSVRNQRRNIVITLFVSFSLLCSGVTAESLEHVSLESLEVLLAQVVEDARQQVLDALCLVWSADNESVGLNGNLHLGVDKVNNASVTLEEVNLLNTSDGLHSEALECSLELLVVHVARLVRNLALSPDSSLSPCAGSVGHRLQLGEPFRV
mmetsp:Transcript_13252/g.18660  ORF Transcript_13252/g.18660 Transcript_13252/m.18660 type:complete len:239 (+) Transcript_13252:107-823(+)